MMLVLLVIVAILVIGGLPRWGYHQYGPYPSSLGAIVLVILLVLVLTGRR